MNAPHLHIPNPLSAPAPEGCLQWLVTWGQGQMIVGCCRERKTLDEWSAQAGKHRISIGATPQRRTDSREGGMGSNSDTWTVRREEL
ncbi:hypothetical protein Hypma_008691 [Hypsizygus marmoreus]|uniref:Uncharacterized protein n=1 Tax=Hypsizygus marmoreus TaxID=39966 RepID=A0A369JPQ0_HYPMA|nr:hypothetical protein Hypma_008691 [Hypsizygus marmoreus]